jgi:hypothetical protein
VLGERADLHAGEGHQVERPPVRRREQVRSAVVDGRGRVPLPCLGTAVAEMSKAVVAKPWAATNSASAPSPQPTTTAERPVPEPVSQSASRAEGRVRSQGMVISSRAAAAYSSSNQAVGRPSARARAASRALSASPSFTSGRSAAYP